MRLSPEVFAADKDQPFLRDRLGRKQQVMALCGLVETIEGHAVVSVDGPWGSGKTAFLAMCSAELRRRAEQTQPAEQAQRQVRVIDFNAWQQSYTNNPLVDLVSAITSELGSSWASDLKTTLLDVSLHLAKIGSRGLIDRDAIRPKESSTFDPWHDAHSKVGELQDALKRACGEPSDLGGAGRIVILIDELDRCRPAYALDLIETVRHLFAVDGVVVVLALNREELCHSIQSLYGADFDANRYLRRFIDLPCVLPPPAPDQLADFTAELLGVLGLDVRFTAGHSQPDYSSPILQKIA